MGAHKIGLGQSNHQLELVFEADSEIAAAQICLTVEAVQPVFRRERAYMVDANYLRYAKCHNSIR